MHFYILPWEQQLNGDQPQTHIVLCWTLFFFFFFFTFITFKFVISLSLLYIQHEKQVM